MVVNELYEENSVAKCTEMWILITEAPQTVSCSLSEHINNGPGYDITKSENSGGECWFEML